MALEQGSERSVYVVAVARHLGAALQPDGAGHSFSEAQKATQPPSLKAGMRSCFWRVFSRAWELDGEGRRFEWYGHDFRLRRTFVFQVGGEGSRGIRGLSYVSVSEIVPVVPTSDTRSLIDQLREEAHAPLEIDLYDTFFSALSGTALGSMMGAATRDRDTNKPALKFFHPNNSGALSPTQESVAPFLVAFYYFAMVLMFRIERAQWEVPISVRGGQLDEGSMRQIAQNRVDLIDFDRDFLTMNRSVLPAVRDLAQAIELEVSIRPQYQRGLELNASMEQHLSNVTQILQTRSSRTSGRALTLLTVLGLPFTIFAAILAYWLGFYSKVSMGLESPNFQIVVLICVLTPVAVWAFVWGIEQMNGRRSVASRRE